MFTVAPRLSTVGTGEGVSVEVAVEVSVGRGVSEGIEVSDRTAVSVGSAKVGNDVSEATGASVCDWATGVQADIARQMTKEKIWNLFNMRLIIADCIVALASLSIFGREKTLLDNVTKPNRITNR